MKNMIRIFLVSGLFLAGCSSKDIPAPNEDVDALHQQFHGKYQIVSSTSSEPVDINLDGKSSVDMFQEYPYLNQHNLRIDIYGPNQYHSAPSFSFMQFWPEQYVRLPSGDEWAGQLVNYEPGGRVNFAMQGSFLPFSFSPDVKKMLVEQNTTAPPFRWQAPESTTVDGEYVRTVNKRRLYTTAGVKDVEITTLYKRYTMAT